MKVLQINSVCGIGSTGKICTDIAKQLIDDGHECKIAYGRGVVPDEYKDLAVRIGSNLDNKLSAVHTRLTGKHGFSNKSATIEFVKWAESYNPDVIHLHNIHGYYINIEILFKYLKRVQKPVVWTLHDCWPFTGHCAHFDMCGCNKWMSHCGNCPQINTYPKSLFDNSHKNFEQKKKIFTSLKNLTIVTPSIWLKTLVNQSFLGCYDVKVINNGINREVFKPTPGNFRKINGLENKKILLGVANIWNKRKGFDDFLKLASMIDEDYIIVLVGLSKKQISGLPKNILGITRTESASELAHIYTTADVFVNPTYEDNYPTVNLEAQACGTPVVTYNTGGSVESVNEECIVNKGDLQSLYKRITYMPMLARDDVVTDKKDMVQKYLTLY